jgi:urea carboxylase
MWNDRQTDDFVDGKPWLLRFFDQLRFFPVSHEELTQIREDFPRGGYRLRVETERFEMRKYRGFLRSIEGEARAFKEQQRTAFEGERTRWRASGELDDIVAAPSPDSTESPHAA